MYLIFSVIVLVSCLIIVFLYIALRRVILKLDQ